MMVDGDDSIRQFTLPESLGELSLEAPAMLKEIIQALASQLAGQPGKEPPDIGFFIAPASPSLDSAPGASSVCISMHTDLTVP